MQRMSTWWVVVALVGCGSSPAAVDAGSVSDTDAGPSSDAGPVDGGRGDAGTDAGPTEGAPRITWALQAWAVDLTPDGRWAAVQDPTSSTGDLYLLEVATGEASLVATVGDPALAFATGMSADRRITALHGSAPVEAGAWTQAGGWVDLEVPFDTDCDPSVGGAWDISADGRIVVGLGWDGCETRAMRWDEDGTPTPLARLGTSSGGARSDRATVISDDGRVMAGFAQTDVVDRWPAVWLADGTGMLLPGEIPDAPGEVLSISADGSVLAGIWNLQGFRYTEAGGVESLGLLPGALGNESTYPNAIAAGGALIFGGSGGFGVTEAFVWTEDEGMRRLQEIAVESGVEIPSGHSLQNVIAASTDGSVVLGTAATESGTPMTFVLELPVSAYGL